MMMQIEELCTLLRAVADTGVQAFTYEENGVKVSIQGKPAPTVQMVQAVAAESPEVQPVLPSAVLPTEEESTVQDENSKEICSPLVGIFYAAPAENAEPFVKVGDSVKAGQTIAIVEAMKLMNEIEAETDGVITEVLVKNAQAVEFGQPLFRIR